MTTKKLADQPEGKAIVPIFLPTPQMLNVSTGSTETKKIVRGTHYSESPPKRRNGVTQTARFPISGKRARLNCKSALFEIFQAISEKQTVFATPMFVFIWYYDVSNCKKCGFHSKRARFGRQPCAKV